MKNKKGKRLMLVVLILSCLLMAVTQASAEDTTIDVIVIGDGNVTGYINGTAINGSVKYYIDGIEVKGEFHTVWDSISKIRGMAQDAYSYAGSAYNYAENNHNTIVELSLTVENNTHKIYMIRDELVAFEGDYLVFKNDTNTNFTYMRYEITQNTGNIEDMKNDIKNLQTKDKELEQDITLLLLPIFGFLVCFGAVIWIFHKQKTYIDNRDKKLEDYVDKQLLLERQLVEEKK